MEHTTTLSEGQPAVGLHTHTHTHAHDNVHYFSSLLGITHTKKLQTTVSFQRDWGRTLIFFNIDLIFLSTF